MTTSRVRLKAIRPEFVEFIPEDLEEGVLYISVPYATASHKCACRCGSLVVTPIRPASWALTWDGESVSLYPSIGNWSFPCQSHYWVDHSRIVWARKWSQEEIEHGRRRDEQARERFYRRSSRFA
jgi:hypothetical protein